MSGSVLIIDADEDFADRLAETLRARGLDPTVTPDGKAGLDLAHINIPSAIVLCVELPRMSGYSICAKLKKDNTLRTVPLVITSAEATQETFEHHKKLKTRAEEYLKKPFEPEVLAEVLARYLPIGEPSSGDDIPLDEDLLMDAEPIQTLSDDEAFPGDDPFAIEEAVDPMVPSRSAIDEAIEGLSRRPPPLPRRGDSGLSGMAGLGSDLADDEEDEAMTMVGVLPPSAREDYEVAELKVRLADLEESVAQARRERDQAAANERAAQQQLQTMSVSQLPGGAAQARELLALKKELNTRDHEILALKGELQDKEKLSLGARDREMELEGRVVQAQEEQEAADRARMEAEGKIAGLESSAADMERALRAELAESQAQTEQIERESAEAREELGTTREELTRLTGELGEREDLLARARSDMESRREELTRISNELSASTAESESLRQQLAGMQDAVDALNARITELESDLDGTHQELDAARRRADEEARRAEISERKVERHRELEHRARAAVEAALQVLAEDGHADGMSPDEGLVIAHRS